MLQTTHMRNLTQVFEKISSNNLTTKNNQNFKSTNNFNIEENDDTEAERIATGKKKIAFIN